jgi:hypothetical protein
MARSAFRRMHFPGFAEAAAIPHADSWAEFVPQCGEFPRQRATAKVCTPKFISFAGFCEFNRNHFQRTHTLTGPPTPRSGKHGTHLNENWISARFRVACPFSRAVVHGFPVYFRHFACGQFTRRIVKCTLTPDVLVVHGHKSPASTSAAKVK